MKNLKLFFIALFCLGATLSFGQTGNTKYGWSALIANTTGDFVTAIGSYALRYNTSGNYNTASGYSALYNNTTGYHNTAIGFYALYYNTTGFFNTANGSNSLRNNTTGIYNTSFGYYSLNENTTGLANTAIGFHALRQNKTGSYNTSVGYLSGPFNNNYNLSNTTALGRGAVPSASNQVRLGNTSVTSIGGYEPWSHLSDGRFKKNVDENVPGIDFINKLRPVTYKHDMEALHQFLHPKGEDIEEDEYSKQARAEKAKITYTGFIAQEVEKAAEELDYDFSGVEAPQNDQSHYSLRYAEFVVPLVVATQEQQQIIETQKAEIEDLKERLIRLEQLISGNEESGQSNDAKSQSIKVYPNPTQGFFTIKLPSSAIGSSSNVQVFNINGRLVFEQNDVKSTQIDIDLSNKVNGNYIVHILQDGKLFSEQLIKQ